MVFIEVGNELRFEDTGLVGGASYRYTIYACTLAANSSCVVTGVTNEVEIARSETPDPADEINASDGNQFNKITVSWSRFSPDAAEFDNPGYLVSVVNPARPANNLVRPVPYTSGTPSAVFNTGPSQDLPSGVKLNFSVRTCSDFDSPSPKCADIQPSDTGFARTRFASGSPKPGVAKIQWQEFSTETDRYRLERCTESSNPVCEFINVGNAVSYSDEGLPEGSRYRYKAFACETPQDNDCIPIGDTSVVTIAGEVEPDVYENDDNPLELNQANQTINANVTQTRSFDTAEDKDWARIKFESGTRQFDIRTTSSNESLDTQLTLFNARGKIVGCAFNTPNNVTGNARLRLPNLPAGDYFLRVEQESGGAILGPIDSYSLITTISVNSSGNAIEFPNCSDLDAFPANATTLLLTPILILLLDE